jgi:hypothetical protein
MDRVRFGRALGFGARHAVKTILTAVDAATAENPSAKSVAAPRPAGNVAARPVAQPARTPARADASRAPSKTTATRSTPSRAIELQKGVRRGAKRFGQEVWNPFARLSGVLWLEVTGVFFGVFALFALGAVLRLHADWRETAANSQDHRRLLGALVMLAVFGYFCVSSFIRAHRRERRR